MTNKVLLFAPGRPASSHSLTNADILAGFVGVLVSRPMRSIPGPGSSRPERQWPILLPSQPVPVFRRPVPEPIFERFLRVEMGRAAAGIPGAWVAEVSEEEE